MSSAAQDGNEDEGHHEPIDQEPGGERGVAGDVNKTNHDCRQDGAQDDDRAHTPGEETLYHFVLCHSCIFNFTCVELVCE